MHSFFQITVEVAIQFRLSKDDAQFVDIIHTDAKKYGIFASIGHIDFFPNGGQRLQPGCEKTDDGKFFCRLFYGFVETCGKQHISVYIGIFYLKYNIS